MFINRFLKKSGAILGIFPVLTFLPEMSAAQAAIITESFTAEVVEGPFAGEVATGSFSYDDALIINGDEILDPTTSLTVNMTFLGQTYTEADDFDYPLFPGLAFSENIPIFLDYYIVDGSPTNIREPSIQELLIGNVNLIPDNGDFITVLEVTTVEATTTTTVPEPISSLSLLLLGGLGLSSTVLKKFK